MTRTVLVAALLGLGAVQCGSSSSAGNTSPPDPGSTELTSCNQPLTLSSGPATACTEGAGAAARTSLTNFCDATLGWTLALAACPKAGVVGLCTGLRVGEDGPVTQRYYGGASQADLKDYCVFVQGMYSASGP